MSEPFDDSRRCPKCNGGAKVKWEPNPWALTGNAGGNIRRTCVRCGYSWYEKPLDAERVQ